MRMSYAAYNLVGLDQATCIQTVLESSQNRFYCAAL